MSCIFIFIFCLLSSVIVFFLFDLFLVYLYSDCCVLMCCIDFLFSVFVLFCFLSMCIQIIRAFYLFIQYATSAVLFALEKYISNCSRLLYSYYNYGPFLRNIHEVMSPLLC